MSSIYIHIPFCKKACNYCNFHFSTNFRVLNSFVDALSKEIIQYKIENNKLLIETIYLGGGTPSVLTQTHLHEIFSNIYKKFKIATISEITLEVNPDNVTEENIKFWKNLGINRISMGVQSFFEDELLFMNRSHNAQQAITSLELISKNFSNFSVDLIFGSHLQTIEQLKENLNILLSFDPPHISCYALTVEDKTLLAKQVKTNKNFEPSQDLQNKGFYIIKDCLENVGYHHYEISNYALPNFESKHNSNYWNGIPYIGFGPSAHSYNTITRSWNIANNALYINASDNFDLIKETETLTPKQIINEFLMIGLRTKKGVDLTYLQQLTSANEFQQILEKCNVYVAKNLIQLNHKFISLTREGLIFADGIAADLFLD